LAKSKEYNAIWDKFFTDNSNPTVEQILNLRKELKEEDTDFPEIQAVIDKYWKL
jgi:hypothetical protein